MSVDFSILMAVYNDENNINKSIESMLSQSVKNFELLLLDDSSTDNTYSICQDYSKSDSRVKLLRNKKNMGLTKSLNILIKESTGKFIVRQDSDDISFKNRILTQYNFIQKHDLDACTSLARVKGKDRIVPNLSRYISPKITINYKNPFIHGTLMIKSNVIKSLGSYDENFYYSQDYKLMKDFIKNGYKIKILNVVLYQLNMEKNISEIYKKEQEYFASCVRKNINPEL
jgi:glycosyltransferase EpsE|tara:strand:- start:930 stop:1616 length:687 start_codon:yes stop_codon:yes gene_type:complete